MAHSRRLARDYYVRLDSNDYSVHPGVIGRRIEVLADLDRVRVLCEGKIVADHERVWAWHQTVTDPEHRAAAKPAAAQSDRCFASRAGARGSDHRRTAGVDRLRLRPGHRSG